MSIACSPQGDLIALAEAIQNRTPTKRHIIRIYSAATGNRLAKFTGHIDTIRSLQFSPDGSRLYSASQDSTVLIWDVTSARASIPGN
jgi:WD40 repeat protein